MIPLVRQNLNSGVLLVADSFLAPSHPFLRLVCQEKGADVCILNVDSPEHRFSWGGTAATVTHAYGASLASVEVDEAWSEKKTLLIVDGVSWWIRQCGVARTLDRMLQLKARCACLVMTVHEDCISSRALAQLQAASTSGMVRMGDEPDIVETVAKRKGGKVVRSRERVLDWKTGASKPLDDLSMASGSSSSGAAAKPSKPELVLEDTNKEEKERLALPFIKTAVSGKMIFDVDDMKEGDYEDDADKSSEDPDYDLDF